jgi:hypothetical protein
VVVNQLGLEVGESLLYTRVPDVELVELGGGVEVAAVASAEVVNDGHFMALGHEPVNHVRADEPGSAGHENTHVGRIASGAPLQPPEA